MKRLRQHPPGQAFYVYVFYENDSVVPDNIAGKLVLEILALIKNVFIDLGQKAHRFLPAMATFCAASHLTLGSTQLGLGFAKPARILVDLPIAGHGKAFQTHVYTDGILADRQRLWFHDTAKADIPPIRFPLERS